MSNLTHREDHRWTSFKPQRILIFEMKLSNNWLCESNVPPNHRSLSSLYSFSWEITPELGCVSTKEELDGLTYSHGFTQMVMHIQHKEGPLLCYTVPQATLPSSSLQDGHRKVQLLASWDSSLHWVYQANPTSVPTSTLGFLTILSTNNSNPSPIFWAAKTGFFHGFRGS